MWSERKHLANKFEKSENITKHLPTPKEACAEGKCPKLVILIENQILLNDSADVEYK